jgi:hypothetical protein
MAVCVSYRVIAFSLLSHHREARPSALYTTTQLNASIGSELLVSGTTYYISIRAHAGWASERFNTHYKMHFSSSSSSSSSSF